MGLCCFVGGVKRASMDFVFISICSCSPSGVHGWEHAKNNFREHGPLFGHE